MNKKEVAGAPAKTEKQAFDYSKYEVNIQDFKTGNIEYKGVIFTKPEEYVELLAKDSGKSEEDVLSAIVQGYQALQMTRTAQAMVNSKTAELNDGDTIHVTTLYGNKRSKWGQLAPFVKIAKDALVGKYGAKYDLCPIDGMTEEEWEAKFTDESIREAATKVKAHMEQNTLDI